MEGLNFRNFTVLPVDLRHQKTTFHELPNISSVSLHLEKGKSVSLLVSLVER